MVMDMKAIKETAIWKLFEKGRNYQYLTNMISDTDRNYRFYNGNQWEGAILGDVEPVQKNFIKPVVKYKVSVIHDNLYAVIYSSQNYENTEFQLQAEEICRMLNRYAHHVWEHDALDYKGRRVTNDAAINSEGIIYVDFNKKLMMPVNEILDKNDVFYGDENEDDIQRQPYILVRKRLPISAALEWAKEMGLPVEKEEYIIADEDSFDNAGDSAKVELDGKVTIVYKLWKEKGTVHFAASTRLCDIVEDKDIKLEMYPIAHFVWEEKKGSARGEGEVRNLIPNQIEVNKTEMRRILTVKTQAYPQKVVDTERVSNPDALYNVGAVIKTRGSTVDDVRKVVGTIPPAQMSADVKMLQDDLIQMTRDLAGAGDSATGQIDPESASGRAILAVQQASQAPMTEQKETYKRFVEDLAKIWLEYMIVHSKDGVALEREVKDPQTGKSLVVVERLSQETLRKLKAVVKIDITPKSVYDRFAQEQTIENLLVQGLFTPNRVGELEVYANLLDDDSVAPKAKILEAVKQIKEEMQRIAQIDSQMQLMQQRAQQFIMEDPDAQAAQVADAQARLMAQAPVA